MLWQVLQQDFIDVDWTPRTMNMSCSESKCEGNHCRICRWLKSNFTDVVPQVYCNFLNIPFKSTSNAVVDPCLLLPYFLTVFSPLRRHQAKHRGVSAASAPAAHYRYHQRICSIMCYPVCVLLYMLLPRKCTNFNKFCVIPIYKLYTPCVCGCVSGSFIIINSFINEISTHWMCLIGMILSFFGKHAKPCCS